MNTKSTHGLFYNPELGKVKRDSVPRTNLIIGNGVWVGHNAIILAPTEHIGDGALIEAGSVVYTNVPPYSIVSGFPARITGYLFSKEVIESLLVSRWWEKSPAQLSEDSDGIGELIAKQYGKSGTTGEKPAERPGNPADVVLISREG